MTTGTTPIVSVIIALYNGAPTIEQCLSSLQTQTLSAIEVIVVDDGSTDTSTAIVDAWIEADKRFRLLRQINAGPAAARNAGLKVARGEFVGFVDADDWVAPQMYEMLYALAIRSKADGARGGQIRHYQRRTQALPLTAADQLIKGSLAYRQLFAQAFLPLMPVYTGIYRRKVLEKTRLAFDERLRNMEDILFNARFFAQNPLIALSRENFYHYRVSESSLSSHPVNLAGSLIHLATCIEALEAESALAASCADAFLHYAALVFLIVLADAAAAQQPQKKSDASCSEQQTIEEICHLPLFQKLYTSRKQYQVPLLMEMVFFLAHRKLYRSLSCYARILQTARQLRWNLRKR
jgi:glycosyltransferase EpsJ